MNLKPQGLLHYYFQAPACLTKASSQGNAFSHSRRMPSVPPSLRVLSTENPDSFRSILLIAALHFAWWPGKLGGYERTYLYHKVKCIESVNKHLKSLRSESALVCMSMVATLCMVEGSMGNLSEAEAHLDGLLAMLDVAPSENDQAGTLQRYIIICMRDMMEWKRVFLQRRTFHTILSVHER
ncbi:hypothetical protein GQ53DRAFT_886066 [Thozetella sp. PMI_491]|nr:hypothetical protein GQ53DRAFT_886066 [Thozetella sp. PMI_491]